MSARTEIAQRVAELIVSNDLATPYGGEATHIGRYIAVTFSKPRDLDGSVEVFGPSFILVRYQTRYGFLPHRGRHVFNSEADALGFLKAAFVDLDEAATATYLSRARQ